MPAPAKTLSPVTSTAWLAGPNGRARDQQKGTWCPGLRSPHVYHPRPAFTRQESSSERLTSRVTAIRAVTKTATIAI